MKLLFSLLNFMGIDEGRTRVEWVSAAEGAKFASTMSDFVNTIIKLGPNRRLIDLRLKNNENDTEQNLNERIEGEENDK